MLRNWVWLTVLLSYASLAAPSPSPTAHEFTGVLSPKAEGLLNRLLAPGPLINGHSRLEHSDCLKCHVLKKGVPDENCTECHKEIGAQVIRKTGFHGLAGKSCVTCHKEHRGRDFDTTKVDPRTFDHKLTGYALEGKHALLKCTECHLHKRAAAKKSIRPDEPRYFGVTTQCMGCHRKHDVHRFTGDYSTKDCGVCHGLKSWKLDVRFDHEKDAKYKLLGKHLRISCAKCHITPDNGSIYKWPKLHTDRCASCHRDPHGANISPKFQGGDCVRCHTQTEWKLKDFNHSVTEFPLHGKHQRIQCFSCHRQTPAALAQGPKASRWTGLPKDCVSCHRDIHGFGEFASHRLPKPRNCSNCHSEVAWKSGLKFNHAQQARFPLKGKHAGLACNKCHIPKSADFLPGDRKGPLSLAQSGGAQKIMERIYEWKQLPEKGCEVCHSNPHLKTFTQKTLARKCTECHTEAAWSEIQGFSHDQATRFPLKGRHLELQCRKCHEQNSRRVYAFASVDQEFCVDCHKNVHIQQFSERFVEKRCSTCHTQTDFITRLEFNHATTRLPLTGRHARLECSKCHLPTREAMPTYASKTKRPGTFKSRFLFPESASKGFCVGCHKNVHLNQFRKETLEKSCAVCHTTENFTQRLPFDHDAVYPLRGKHGPPLKCEKCHVRTGEYFEGRAAERPRPKSRFVFADLKSRNCATCHKDPHKGTFGPKCAECHTEQHWRKTRDFHKNFTLSGVHFSVECDECHREGRRLEGMSEQCSLCHQKDDIHHGALPSCGECHRQQFWENPEFKHSLSRFPLRGVHRTLDCYLCHRNGIYKGTPSSCVDCHLQDALAATVPPHVGDPSLASRNCFECHNQFSFR